MDQTRLATNDGSRSGSASDDQLERTLAEVQRLRDEIEGKAAELQLVLERLRRISQPGDHSLRRPADATELSRSEAATVAPPRGELLLRAAQMAIAGRTRLEIDADLRGQFGVDDPDPILDRILGETR